MERQEQESDRVLCPPSRPDPRPPTPSPHLLPLPHPHLLPHCTPLGGTHRHGQVPPATSAWGASCHVRVHLHTLVKEKINPSTTWLNPFNDTLGTTLLHVTMKREKNHKIDCTSKSFRANRTRVLESDILTFSYNYIFCVRLIDDWFVFVSVAGEWLLAIPMTGEDTPCLVSPPPSLPLPLPLPPSLPPSTPLPHHEHKINFYLCRESNTTL